MKTKVCIACPDKTPKPISAFGKHRSRPDGLADRCNECSKAWWAEYRKTHPHQRKAHEPIAIIGKKFCSKCEQEKDYSAFQRDRYTSDGYSYHCKLCIKPRKRITQMRRSREKRLLSSPTMQHIAPFDKDTVIEAIRSIKLCDICGQSESTQNQYGVKQLAIDHDHRTGRFRGLLCFSCNTGLGHFKDNPELLERAIEYLQRSAVAENAG